MNQSRRGRHACPKLRKNKLRLSNWDYFSPGPYFFTICTDNKKELFIDDFLKNTVIEQFRIIAEEYGIKIHNLITAANHIHGIITLKDDSLIGLSKYIGKTKVSITKILSGQACLPLRDNINIWQRSFYDHVIRNEQDFIEKANYIEKHLFKEDGNLFSEWH